MADKKLISEAKAKLRVTWEDDDDDARILRLIDSAQADLNGLCGKRLSYSKEGKAKTLMLEHVFYNWNNALHEFRKNYQDELTELILLSVAGGL